ncbi:MAG: four helix bundle protein [Opitutaceae bacterium]|nr:four helix bundle protein [Opitutaceae bacterium]
MSRLPEELRQRCKGFASGVIRLHVELPRERDEVAVIGRQLLRAGTSVAAHSREASRARSETEFISKLEVLLQEADESALWLELLEEDCGLASGPLTALLTEAGELLAIFTSIVAKLKRHDR